MIDSCKKILTDSINSEFEIIHNARNILKKVLYKNEYIIIKSFKIPHIINRFVYSFFRPSKAKKSYINGKKIGDFTPKPICYFEEKKFGLIYNSYYVAKEFEYDFTIREPLLDIKFLDRNNIFKAFANFTYNLHQKRVFHLDYSPGNILIKKHQNSYEFKIVDINRVIFNKLNTKKRLKNFSKLWAKDEDLKIIIKEYAKLIYKDEQKSINIALKYSQAHKNRINAKKRRRGQKVVD